MDITEKKKFIYNNINKIKYHNEIINYIKENDIKYTENNNGFFLNISLIDEHINNIYNILQYVIENNIENNKMDNIKQELLLNNNNIYNKKINNNVDKNIKYNINLNNFNKEEQTIILLSKKYKFDN